ncbi:MAG TPA: phosphatase PAP2 family protein [Bacillales bacterium]|nr:phosphatase PAP2 family protein [Bacillales bacterium]
MIASFFADLVAFIAAYPHLAYAAILLLALSESLPAIGVFIPGTAAILAVSALVPSGVVKLWPLLGAATIGAIIGDGLSFWIGYHYHREILERWPLNRHPELIARSKEFFARHGDMSVFIARFTPGVRAFVPLIAGTLRMPARRFYAANILSALVWAPSHILPAVFVGAAFGLFGAAAKPLAILAVLAVIVIWTAIRLVQLVLRHGPPLLSRLSAWLRVQAAAGDSRWHRMVLDLLDPTRPDARVVTLVALVLAGSAWLFFGILEDIVSGDPLVRVDTAIYQALQDLRTGPGDAIMLVITELGDTVVVLAITVAVSLWLLWQRNWRSAAYWLGAVGGASALNTAIKVALHRLRPTELLYSGWSAFSFPSGHSTVNLVLYGFLAFLIGRELRAAWRLPVVLVMLSMALLIAFSRLYLGAHWFSDVVGGLAFGTAWLTILVFFYLRKETRPVGAVGLIVVAGLALGLAGGWNVSRHHGLDMQRYARKTEAMVRDAWLSTDRQRFPARRTGLSGEIEKLMTIQRAGSLPLIKQPLFRNDWRNGGQFNGPVITSEAGSKQGCAV